VQNGGTDRDVVWEIGMLSQASTGNTYYMVCKCPNEKGDFCVVWPIEKYFKTYDFGDWTKGMSCAKTGGPVLTIYTSYDVFFRKELPFGDRDDSTSVKKFSGVDIFNRD